MRKISCIIIVFFIFTGAVADEYIYAGDLLDVFKKNVVEEDKRREVPTFLDALKGAMYAFENDNVCEFKRLSSEYFLMHEMHGMSLEDDLLVIDQVYRLLKLEKQPVDHVVFVDLKRLANDVYRHRFPTRAEKWGFLHDEFMSCLDLEEN